MWSTLLLMAIAVSLEPVRLGLAVVMLNRPRPILQLLVFLCGGFAMGLAVGAVVLTALDATPLAADQLTVPRAQIVIGILAIGCAAVLAASSRLRRSTTGAEPEPAGEPATGRGRFAARTREMMAGGSLWVAGVSGLGIALPSVDYLAALALIHASGFTPAGQFGALVAFNAVAFILVEIPLLSYVFAPQATTQRLAALHSWVRSRTRMQVAGLLAAIGLLLIGLGLTGW